MENHWRRTNSENFEKGRGERVCVCVCVDAFWIRAITHKRLCLNGVLTN